MDNCPETINHTWQIVFVKSMLKKEKKMRCIKLGVAFLSTVFFTGIFFASISLTASAAELSAGEELPDGAEKREIIIFGCYEQDNDPSNGKEDIEWIVLTKEDNKVLLLSKYALDCKVYCASYTGVTWETCSLRKWLNGPFMRIAFSSDEIEKIAAATVTADENPEYPANPGNDTQDDIFLLSISEAEQSFTEDSERECLATAYAEDGGIFTGNNGKCWWWLRTPGYDGRYAAGVRPDGILGCHGHDINLDFYCVRPALWIYLDE